MQRYFYTRLFQRAFIQNDFNIQIISILTVSNA